MIRGQTGLVLDRGLMNLALEKGERVTMEGKSRGEIGGEAGEVTGWLQMCLPWMTWEKGIECLVDGG